MGIRPEHVYDAHRCEGAEVKARVKAKVEVAEPMGNEIYVYFSTKPGTMHVARLSATEEPEPSREMGFVFDTSKVHLFEAETGKAVLG